MTTLVVAALVTLAAVAVMTAVLPRLGVMDVPNHRSSHARPVPRGGGLPVVPAVALALLVTAQPPAAVVGAVLGALALGVVGLVDDVRDVPAPLRLGLQLVVGAVVAALLVRGAEGWAAAPLLAVPLVAFWLAAYVNVFNFMDGANGVAGAQALLAGLWYAHVGSVQDVAGLTAAGLALAGGAIGFLPHNFPRSRVFLGDVGSYSVGFLVASLAVVTLVGTGSLLLALAPVLVFLVDTSVTLARRAATGQPVMTAHREHAYQRLTAAPGSPVPALVTAAFSVLCLLVALTTSALVCVVLWVVLLAVYVALPRLLEGRGTRPGT